VTCIELSRNKTAIQKLEKKEWISAKPEAYRFRRNDIEL